MEQWRHVFLIAATVLVVTNLIYVCTASGEIQPWNDPPHTEKVYSASEKDRRGRVMQVRDDMSVYHPQLGFRKTTRETYFSKLKEMHQNR